MHQCNNFSYYILLFPYHSKALILWCTNAQWSRIHSSRPKLFSSQKCKYLCLYVSVYVFVCLYMFVRFSAYMCAYVYVCVYLSVSVCVCEWVCVSMCVCLFVLVFRCLWVFVGVDILILCCNIHWYIDALVHQWTNLIMLLW